MIKNELISQKHIIDILKKYEIIDNFNNIEEINNWISELNELQISNLLSLNIDPTLIKFNTKLLIDKNLLNTNDYLKRVSAFISIKNADGWYHLFDSMLNPDFLNSPKFYQDIETLKRAESAQTPLWVIGEKDFINSPYHDEDFELLVTVKDNSGEKLDFVLEQVIATVIKNKDSINSEYHKIDLETIVKYGSSSLNMPHRYPESSIGNLAINKVSLKDNYHLENMEILANNYDIGNFLYPIMTDESIMKKSYYRTIIEEIIKNKDNRYIAFMLCSYVVGPEKAKNACNIGEYFMYEKIKRKYDMNDLLKKIDDKFNIIEGCIKEEVPQIETNKKEEKSKSLIKKYLTIKIKYK